MFISSFVRSRVVWIFERMFRERFLTGGIVWMLKNVRYITVALAIVPCVSLEMAGKNFKISRIA